MMRVAGHVFEGRPCTVPCGNELGVGACFPNPFTPEMIEEFQNATELEVLDDRTGMLSESYHLTSWYAVEAVDPFEFDGLAFYWKVSWYDEADILKLQVQQLELENEELRQTNADLTEAAIELASIIGDL